MNAAGVGAAEIVPISKLDMVNIVYGDAWSDPQVISHLGDFEVLIVSNWINQNTLDMIHAAGTKAVAYVSFYHSSPYEPYQGAFAGDHPEWWCRNADGSPRPSCFGDSYEPGFITMCPNSPSYRQYCAEFVKYLMDRGFDGVFVDNCHPDQVCYGDVIGAHEHAFPQATNDYALRTLLAEVRALVKSYGEDKLLIANGGNLDSRWVGVCDAQMQESYIASLFGPSHKWPESRTRQLLNDWSDASDSGEMPCIATSYLAPQQTRADAYYCYAWARVCGFIWCDKWTAQRTASDLYQMRLGDPLEPPREYGTYWKRSYQNGLVIVTKASRSSSTSVRLPSGSVLYDAYKGAYLKQTKRSALNVRLPTGSGRVYICSG